LTFVTSNSIGGSRQIHRPSVLSSQPAFKKLNKNDSETVAQTLRPLVGEQNVSLAEAVRSQHGQDEGPDNGDMPDVVVFAESTEHVSEICKICYERSIPIIPHGTGTGLEAGISALHGGICIDLQKMDEISDYHPEDFDVCVRPGVTREGLNHFVKDDGVWFPVDPGANASICGMCATGASGTNAVRYGTIKENCLNMEVVLPDGRILHTGGKDKRPRKSSAGYNLTNLMIGSEGTLGIITKATVKLHAQPEAIAAAVVNFPDIQSAVDTVVMTLQCSMPMARMELLDSVAVKACNNYSNLSLEERPTLFLEFHSTESGLEYQTSTVHEIAKDYGGSDFSFAIKQEDRNKLWTARHKLYYAGINMRAGCRSVTTDACVPISQLPEMLLKTREDIDAAGLTAPLFGHVGDGNFHSLLLFDPEKPEEYEACKKVSMAMGERAMALGGTCTGEHGIGTGKRRLLHEMVGNTGLEVMWSIKQAFDPKGIMNPGKVLRPLE